MASTYQYLFKIALAGETRILLCDSGVGKSCMLSQFVQQHFKGLHDVTIGVEFGSKIIYMDSRPIKLQIWDLGGQRAFRGITTSYYRGVMGVILVYDITDYQSFRDISQQLNNLRSHAHSDTFIILVGNKCDLILERQVSTREGQQFAQNNGISYFCQISSKTRENIDLPFIKFIKLALQYVDSGCITNQYGMKVGNFKKKEENVKLKLEKQDLMKKRCKS